MHAALGVPGAQRQVGVVHERIQGRRVLGRGPQKQHRKLNKLQQLGVAEILARVLGHALQQVEAHRAFHNFPVHKLHYRAAGQLHKFVDTDVVLVLGLGQKSIEAHRAARLQAFKQLPQLGHAGRNIHGIITLKNDLIRRVEPHQFVIVGHLFAKLGEVLVKHARHPVPAGAHIEGESCGLKHAGPAAGAAVLFQQRYLPAGLG